MLNCLFIPTFARCPSSLNPHFCVRTLHRPVPIRGWFRLDQVCHASLEPGGSDSLGWRRACVVLSGYGRTRQSVFECGCCHQWVQQSGGRCVLIWVSFWMDLAHRMQRVVFLFCFSSWDETARLICRGQFHTSCIGHLLSLVTWIYMQRSRLGRSLTHAMVCSRLGTRIRRGLTQSDTTYHIHL